jgi:hypothetical protein
MDAKVTVHDIAGFQRAHAIFASKMMDVGQICIVFDVTDDRVI